MTPRVDGMSGLGLSAAPDMHSSDRECAEVAGRENRAGLHRFVRASLKTARIMPESEREGYLERSCAKLNAMMADLERATVPFHLVGVQSADITAAIATLAGAIPK